MHFRCIIGGVRCHSSFQGNRFRLVNAQAWDISEKFHRHGEVVGAVVEGLCQLGGNGVVIALVDALVEVVAVVADSLVGVGHIT